MQTTTKPSKPNYMALLTQAINNPGTINQAYHTFTNFSITNKIIATIQILNKGEELAPIATFKKWQTLGRQVKKGEKAISLWMPIIKKDKEDPEKQTMFFMMKPSWFTLNQTEQIKEHNNEEQEPSNLSMSEWNKEKALQTLNINEVPFNEVNGNIMGYAYQNNFAINPIAFAPMKTMFHELAHVVLEHTTNEQHQLHDSKSIMEVEAESVSYLICSILGHDKNLADSRGYIQSYLKDQELKENNIKKIFNAVDKILKAGGIE